MSNGASCATPAQAGQGTRRTPPEQRSLPVSGPFPGYPDARMTAARSGTPPAHGRRPSRGNTGPAAGGRVTGRADPRGQIGHERRQLGGQHLAGQQQHAEDGVQPRARRALAGSRLPGQLPGRGRLDPGVGLLHDRPDGGQGGPEVRTLQRPADLAGCLAGRGQQRIRGAVGAVGGRPGRSGAPVQVAAPVPVRRSRSRSRSRSRASVVTRLTRLPTPLARSRFAVATRRSAVKSASPVRGTSRSSHQRTASVPYRAARATGSASATGLASAADHPARPGRAGRPDRPPRTC